MAMTVAELLAASRAAHGEYRRAAGRINREGKISHPPNLRSAGGAVQTALTLRLEAHRLDPEHLDSAWALDLAENKGVSHDALVAFLARYLTPGEARA